LLLNSSLLWMPAAQLAAARTACGDGDHRREESRRHRGFCS
jgi:hypothetical protein